MSHAVSLAFTMACLVSPVAHAFDDTGLYAAQGAMKCEVFPAAEARARDAAAAARIEGWVEGYVGAFNWLVPDTFQILGDSDVHAVLVWLDRYCEENPQGDTADGMELLVGELYAKRKRKHPR